MALTGAILSLLLLDSLFSLLLLFSVLFFLNKYYLEKINSLNVVLNYELGWYAAL